MRDFGKFNPAKEKHIRVNRATSEGSRLRLGSHELERLR